MMLNSVTTANSNHHGATPIEPTPPTILIVDDDTTNRQLLMMILQRENCRVLEAGDGLEAIEMFRRAKPDVVLMDALMPMMDGFEACRRIKELPNGEHTPILMVTSLDDDDSVRKAFEAGAIDYLNRPFRVDVIRHRLRAVLNAKRAEDALRQSEANLRAIFNSGAMFVLMLDREGRLQTYNEIANRYMRTYMGVEIREGMHLIEAIEKKYRSWYLNHLQTALEGRSVVVETRLQRSEKSEWFELNLEPVFDEKNHVRGVCVLGKIITDRKIAEKTLEQRTKILETVNDVSVDVAKTLELNELLTKVARWLAESVDATSVYVCDYKHEQQAGTVLAEYVSKHANKKERVSDLGVTYHFPQDLPNIPARIHDPRGYATYSIDDTLDPAEHNHLHQYGANSILLVPFRVEDKIVGYVEIWESRRHRVFDQDEIDLVCLITNQVAVSIVNAQLYTSLRESREELRHYADELEATNSDLDAYNHTIAHDLKNPINLIVNYANLVELEAMTVLNETTLDRLRKVQQYTMHMSRMIDQMLRFTQLRKVDDVVRPVEVQAAIEAGLARFEDVIPQNNIQVILESPFPSVMGVDGWLEEVFANFVGNAIKYRGEENPNPTIIIRGRQEGEVVRYEVEDNGIGISKENHQRLFEMFTRLYTVKTDGFGLGLSIVHRIITRLKGHVGVESELGKGSIFWFTLPIAE